MKLPHCIKQELRFRNFVLQATGYRRPLRYLPLDAAIRCVSARIYLYACATLEGNTHDDQDRSDNT